MSAATTADPDLPGAPHLPEGDTAPIRILLIEDQFEIARLFIRRLHWSPSADFAVRHVDNLTEGLREIETTSPDLILLDLLLPETEGLDTIRKATARANGTPIVVLSSQDDESLARAAIREGVQDFLIKQEQDARSLVRTIVHTLERSRHQLTSSLRSVTLEPQGA